MSMWRRRILKNVHDSFQGLRHPGVCSSHHHCFQPPIITTAPTCPDAADAMMNAFSKALARNAGTTDAVCIRRRPSNKLISVGQLLDHPTNKASILRPSLKNVYEITGKQNY